MQGNGDSNQRHYQIPQRHSAQGKLQLQQHAEEPSGCTFHTLSYLIFGIVGTAFGVSKRIELARINTLIAKNIHRTDMMVVA